MITFRFALLVLKPLSLKALKLNKDTKKIFKKRGQISLFIIIGILILFIIIGSIYTYSYIKEKQAELEAEKKAQIELETQKIKEFIDSCISKVSYQGIEKIGRQGGYIAIPSIINFKGTAFWYLDEINIQPTLEQINTYLKDYIDDNIPLCTAGFETFKSQGFEIK